jgi:hypothetical protein
VAGCIPCGKKVGHLSLGADLPAKGDLAERQTLDALRTETKRDAFRIIRNFARKAEQDQMPDFPVSIEYLAGTLNVSHQTVSEIRKRFIELRVIERTADHIVNRAAARFRWLLSAEMGLPGKGASEGIEQPA